MSESISQNQYINLTFNKNLFRSSLYVIITDNVDHQNNVSEIIKTHRGLVFVKNINIDVPILDVKYVFQYFTLSLNDIYRTLNDHLVASSSNMIIHISIVNQDSKIVDDSLLIKYLLLPLFIICNNNFMSVFLDNRSNFFKSSQPNKVISNEPNLSISNFLLYSLNVSITIDDWITSLPYPAIKTLSLNESIGANPEFKWSNALRIHSLSFASLVPDLDIDFKSIAGIDSRVQNHRLRSLVFYVGTHPIILSYALELGVKILFIEKVNYSSHTYMKLLDTHKISDSDIYKSKNFTKSTQRQKLVMLDSIIYNRYKNILYIGAAPGTHLKQFRLLKRNGIHQTSILYDPEFSSNDKLNSDAIDLESIGHIIFDNRFEYSIQQFEGLYDLYFKSSISNKQLYNDDVIAINDDVWVPNYFNLLVLKLNFYDLLLTKYKDKIKIDVYLKFNLKPDQSASLTHVYDIYQQPFAGSSFEVRVVLSNYLPDTKNIRINGMEHKYIMEIYNKMPMKQKLALSRYNTMFDTLDIDFFDFTVEKASEFVNHSTYDYSILALHSISNYTIESKNKLSLIMEYLNSMNINILFTMYSHERNVNHNIIEYDSKSHLFKKNDYQDMALSQTDVINMYHVSEITISQLFNATLLIKSMSNLNNFSREGTSIFKPDYSNTTIMYLTNNFPFGFKYIQTNLSDPSFRIKAATYIIRDFCSLSTKYFFLLRANAVNRILCNLNVNDYIIVNTKDVVVRFNKSLNWQYQYDSNIFNLNVYEDETVQFSGHLINLILSTLYNDSQLKQWLLQWAVNVKSKEIMQGIEFYRSSPWISDDTHFIDALFNHDSSDQPSKIWHSYNDIIFTLLSLEDISSYLFINDLVRKKQYMNIVQSILRRYFSRDMENNIQLIINEFS